MWSPLFYSNEPTSLTHENFSHIYFHRIIVSDIVRLYREKGTRKINKLSIPSSIIANISLFRSFPLFFFFQRCQRISRVNAKVKSGTGKYVRNFFSKFCQDATRKETAVTSVWLDIPGSIRARNIHTRLELNRGTDTSWPSIQFDSPLDRRYQFRDAGNGDTVRVGKIDGGKRRSGMRRNGGRGAGEQYIDLFFFKSSFFNGVNFITLLIY